jgi:hypothetical protein
MAPATAFHILRGEYGLTAVTAVLGAIAAFVAHGRRTLSPIQGMALTPRALLIGLAVTATSLLLVLVTLPEGWNR